MNVALRRVIRVHTVLIQIQNKSITFCIYFIALLLLILVGKKIFKKKTRERESKTRIQYLNFQILKKN